jgi:hypothetical protein
MHHGACWRQMRGLEVGVICAVRRIQAGGRGGRSRSSASVAGWRIVDGSGWLHRLLAEIDRIRRAVLIVAAGMEGALPEWSGLVTPLIAVPISAGYGASFGVLLLAGYAQLPRQRSDSEHRQRVWCGGAADDILRLLKLSSSAIGRFATTYRWPSD